METSDNQRIYVASAKDFDSGSKEGNHIHVGVFSTPDKAKDALEPYIDQYSQRLEGLTGYAFVQIREHVLDVEDSYLSKRVFFKQFNKK